MELNSSLMIQATVYLYWCGLQSEDFVASTTSVAIHVNKNVYAIGVNSISSFAIARNLPQWEQVRNLIIQAKKHIQSC